MTESCSVSPSNEPLLFLSSLCAHDMLRVHIGAIPERTQCTRGAIYYTELTYGSLEQQAEKDSLKTQKRAQSLRYGCDRVSGKHGFFFFFLVNGQRMNSYRSSQRHVWMLYRDLIWKWNFNWRIQKCKVTMRLKKKTKKTLTLTYRKWFDVKQRAPSAVYSGTQLVWGYIRVGFSLYCQSDI